MPIIDVQYRLRELGRLRMGVKTPKGAPKRLDTWRLTSASKELLDAAAEVYGGEVQLWKDAPNEGDHFELITESSSLDIVIPPNDAAFSQWMELWSGGGCKKRCDGERQVLRDVACSCPKDINERIEKAKNGQACKPVTRFNVMLPKVPDIGVWRMESHGYNAAVELHGFLELVTAAAESGRLIPARLRIDQRSTKRDGKTHRFIVPVVEMAGRIEQALTDTGAIDASKLGLPAPIEGRTLPGEQPALPPDPSFAIEEEHDPDADWETPTRGANGTESNPDDNGSDGTERGGEDSVQPGPTAPPSQPLHDAAHYFALIEAARTRKTKPLGFANVLRSCSSTFLKHNVKPPARFRDMEQMDAAVLADVCEVLGLESDPQEAMV